MDSLEDVLKALVDLERVVQEAASALRGSDPRVGDTYGNMLEHTSRIKELGERLHILARNSREEFNREKAVSASTWEVVTRKGDGSLGEPLTFGNPRDAWACFVSLNARIGKGRRDAHHRGIRVREQPCAVLRPSGSQARSIWEAWSGDGAGWDRFRQDFRGFYATFKVDHALFRWDADSYPSRTWICQRAGSPLFWGVEDPKTLSVLGWNGEFSFPSAVVTEEFLKAAGLDIDPEDEESPVWEGKSVDITLHDPSTTLEWSLGI